MFRSASDLSDRATGPSSAAIPPVSHPRPGRWLALSFIFLLAVFLADRALGSAVMKLSHGAYRETIQGLARRDGRLDILFLGTSHTYSSVDPALFDRLGLKTYALALPGASPELYDLALSAFLRHNPSPRLLAIESSYLTFTSISDPSLARMLPEFDWSTRFQSWRASGRLLPPASLYSEVARFHRDIRTSLRTLSRLSRPPVAWDRGFIPTTGALVPGDRTALEHLIVPADGHMRPPKLRAFERLLSRVGQLGVPALVYEPPEFVDALGPDYQPQRDRFLAWAESAARHHGFGFVSYNEPAAPASLNRRPELFRNGDHLNADGAAIFSPLFARDLGAFLQRLNQPKSVN